MNNQQARIEAYFDRNEEPMDLVTQTALLAEGVILPDEQDPLG